MVIFLLFKLTRLIDVNSSFNSSNNKMKSRYDGLVEI